MDDERNPVMDELETAAWSGANFHQAAGHQVASVPSRGACLGPFI